MSETAIEEMVTETAEIGDRDQGSPKPGISLRH